MDRVTSHNAEVKESTWYPLERDGTEGLYPLTTTSPSILQSTRTVGLLRSRPVVGRHTINTDYVLLWPLRRSPEGFGVRTTR